MLQKHQQDVVGHSGMQNGYAGLERRQITKRKHFGVFQLVSFLLFFYCTGILPWYEVQGVLLTPQPTQYYRYVHYHMLKGALDSRDL
jgi:hypothetical protein